MKQIPNYTSVKGMTKKFPDICTEGGLRWEIFNAETNGLAKSGAIIRKGRRVLIDIEQYFQWINSLQSSKKIGGV